MSEEKKAVEAGSLDGTIDRVMACIDQAVYILDGLKNRKYPATLVRPSIGMAKGLLKSSHDELRKMAPEEVVGLGGSVKAPGPAPAPVSPPYSSAVKPKDAPDPLKYNTPVEGSDDDFPV